ncbi:MAG: hydroxyisourate hydrolase [Acidobacteriaceae bacterium]|nr:hydroxyisourate hydrolase [Acidobacteriaceae bacterium]
MSGISTHVLDTSAGRPAAGIRVRLFRGEQEIASEVTNSDGRCPALLPHDVAFEEDIYRIVFEIEREFPHGFYPEIAISFRVSDASAHYHVPLLLSPFGYTTYRGS